MGSPREEGIVRLEVDKVIYSGDLTNARQKCLKDKHPKALISLPKFNLSKYRLKLLFLQNKQTSTKKNLSSFEITNKVDLMDYKMD